MAIGWYATCLLNTLLAEIEKPKSHTTSAAAAKAATMANLRHLISLLISSTGAPLCRTQTATSDSCEHAGYVIETERCPSVPVSVMHSSRRVALIPVPKRQAKARLS